MNIRGCVVLSSYFRLNRLVSGWTGALVSGTDGVPGMSNL